MKKEEAEKRAREIIERWDLSIGEGSLKDSIAASLMEASNNAVADLKSRLALAKEALKFYDNTLWSEARTDGGFMVKRPCDERWFPIQNKAREALAAIEKLEGK